MRFASGTVAAIAALAVLLAPGSAAAPPVAAQEQGQVQVEWLGHMFFRLTSPNGVVVLTSPWLMNRDVPLALDDIRRADIILAPNSHPDDYGQANEVAAQTGGRVITPQRLGEWNVARRGLSAASLVHSEVGQTHVLDGITVNVVLNVHDNTIRDEPEWDAGEAIGFYVTFENGFTVYFAASSAPYAEMRDHARLFQPNLALVNSSNNNPEQFADIVQHLMADNPSLTTVIPTHRAAAALEYFEYSLELEQRGVPITFFRPDVGVVYRY